MGSPNEADPRDVFLSHSHLDADWVELLAVRLEDERGLRPWLDRWLLIPGKPWQRELARGLAEATSCAICLGANTPRGWFEKEIEKALNRQARDDDFRVIPVLLPTALDSVADALQATFLDLNTWVDFRDASSMDHAFHVLACGVEGVAPGRKSSARGGTHNANGLLVDKLHELRRLRQSGLVDDSVAVDLQRTILRKLLDV